MHLNEHKTVFGGLWVKLNWKEAVPQLKLTLIFILLI